MSKRSLRTALLVALALTLASMSVAFADEAPTATPTPTQTLEPSPTPTATPSPTPDPTEPPACHPVAFLIALAFDQTCADVEALHDSGVGFGVIGRAYLTAAASDGELTPEQVVELHQSGVGWGTLMKEYGIHPGGKGLGTIVSGRFSGATPEPEPEDGDGAVTGSDRVKPDRGNPFRNGDWKPGNSGNPPGQDKDKNPRRKP